MDFEGRAPVSGLYYPLWTPPPYTPPGSTESRSSDELYCFQCSSLTPTYPRRSVSEYSNSIDSCKQDRSRTDGSCRIRTSERPCSYSRQTETDFHSHNWPTGLKGSHSSIECCCRR